MSHEPDAHPDSPHSAAADHAAHHGSGKMFLVVFVLLCILTAISFGVANSPIMDTKEAGWLVMMAVSCCKAMLVISFFMHLLWEANWKYVLTFPALTMSILLAAALVPDIYRRMDHYSREREVHAAVPEREVAPEHGEGTSSQR